MATRDNITTQGPLEELTESYDNLPTSSTRSFTVMSSPVKSTNATIDPSSTSEDQHPPSDPAPTSSPRLDALVKKRARLEASVAALEAQCAIAAAKIKLPPEAAATNEDDDQGIKPALSAAHAIVKRHIQLLHRYNEIKDVGQGLIGMVADTRGERIASVMEDFGMSEKD